MTLKHGLREGSPQAFIRTVFILLLSTFNEVTQSVSQASYIQYGGSQSTVNLYVSTAQQKAQSIRILNESLAAAIEIFNQNEITILFRIRQEPNSAATLLHLEDINSRMSYLEVHSQSRKAEVRFYYGDQNGGVRDVIFEHVQLGDTFWHEVAIRVSGDQVTLFVDCKRLGSRNIPDRQRKVHNDARLLLFGKSGNFELKGDVKYLKVSSNAFAIQKYQCPQMDVECPTCGQFQEFQRQVFEAFAKLEERNRQLELRVEQMSRAESDRMNEVNELQRSCLPVCWKDGKRYENSSSWDEGCNVCSCKNKEVTCEPIACPVKADCSDVRLHRCCRQSCDRGCFDSGSVVPHLTEVYKRSQNGCVVAKCVSGVLSFSNVTCANLSCSEENRIYKEGSCCPICREENHCGSSMAQCAENALCVGHGFSAKCQCIDGYHGDGQNRCEDIDECTTTNARPHHCPENSVCVNTPGNYSCHCNTGFEMDSRGFCVDIDECAEKNFCDSGASCVNLKGSYQCICPAGYRSEGRSCQPICTSPCKHGGICVAPDRCECRLGYRGAFCEYDVDECQENLHRCGPHATCVNQPGWYTCKCDSGFQPSEYNGSAVCLDINECMTGQHTCPVGSICRNRKSSYYCQCSGNDCTKHCQVPKLGQVQTIANGGNWLDETTCESCSCQDGAHTCKPVQCNCNENPNRQCCPHCFQEEESQCKFRTDNGTSLILANGQRFVHGCQICECMFGSLDCWTAPCPKLSCAEPVFPGDLCCPICPKEDPCFPLEGGHGRGCHYMNLLFAGNLRDASVGRAATCKGCPTSGHILNDFRNPPAHTVRSSLGDPSSTSVKEGDYKLGSSS